jgi:Zn ribbon nucleic-acid-binding protein
MHTNLYKYTLSGTLQDKWTILQYAAMWKELRNIALVNCIKCTACQEEKSTQHNSSNLSTNKYCKKSTTILTHSIE